MKSPVHAPSLAHGLILDQVSGCSDFSGLAAVNIGRSGRSQVAQRFMNPLVVVVLDEFLDLGFKLPRQEVVVQVDHVF